jgi:membrane protein DedA with SNARE-associated domain
MISGGPERRCRLRWTSRPGARWCLLAVLLLSIILIPFALWGEGLDAWVGAGRWTETNAALAAAAGAALLTADVLLPVPSSVILTMLGVVLGAWPGTLVGTLGLTVGCALGYAIGWAVGTPATRRLAGEPESRRAAVWLGRHGVAALVLCRAVPVLAEASVITAGALRMAPLRVGVATTLSNLGISGVYARVGAWAIDSWSFLLAFALAIAVPAVVLIAARAVERVWAESGRGRRVAGD